MRADVMFQNIDRQMPVVCAHIRRRIALLHHFRAGQQSAAEFHASEGADTRDFRHGGAPALLSG